VAPAVALGAGEVFVPVTPCRVADTRIGAPIASGATRTFQVTGTGLSAQGGASAGCAIPDGAVAVEVSVTTPAPPGTGFLRAWPSDVAPPNAAFVNFTFGRGTTNTGAVRLSGASGTADLSVAPFGSSAHVILDVQGYFVASSPSGAVFVPVTPCRVVDTRSSSPVVAGATRTFQVAGSGLSGQGGSPAGCGVPDAAVAVEVSVTAPAPPGTGFLRAWPADSPPPNATMVNYSGGQGTTNTGAVRLSAAPGTADLSVAAFTSSTHVIVDVQGYFVASDPTGAVFVPVTPCRVVDTRSSSPLAAESTRTFQIAGSGLSPQGGSPAGCGVPAEALGVEMSVTTPAPPGTGFLRAWPADASPPNATMVNFTAAQGTTNTGAVRLASAPGDDDLTVGVFGSTSNVIVDVQGFFVSQTWSPSGPQVGSFTASPSSAPAPALVAFAWTVSDPDDDALTCAIDGDGDGTDDVTVSNCENPGSRNVMIPTAGVRTARLTVSDGAATTQVTTPVIATADPVEAYDIELRFQGSPSIEQQGFFIDAAARWESIVVRGVPSATVAVGLDGCGADTNQPIFQVVDDLVIDVIVTSIDGVGGILGQAGPCSIATVDDLPRFGVMKFDSADVSNLITQGRFDETVTHEMAHVLGFGSLWGESYQDLLGGDLADPRFEGLHAIAEWNVLGRSGTVPVEAGGGAGTARSHWRESTFDTELMTGFLDFGANPLSRLSIASMADMGLQVDLDQADPYSLPGSFLRLQRLLEAGHDGHLHTEPLAPVAVAPPAP
jgi:hypothetical protein